MKLNKLLLAASAVALTATSASALDLTVNTPTATVTPALELEFPQPAGNVAALNFTVETSTVGGEYPAGNNLLVAVVLPAGTSLSAPVTAGDITSSGGTVSSVVQAGGQANDNSVNLLISIPQTGGIADLIFDFDVKLDECPDAASPLVVSIETEGGVDIENGTVTSGSFVAPCRSAVDVAILDDEAVVGGVTLDANGDTFIALPDYTTLSDDVVGFVNGSIDGTVARSIDGTAVDNTDITSVSLDIVLEDTTGLASVTFLGQTQAIVAGQLAYTFVLTGADKDAFFDGTADAVTLTDAGGTDQIETQQLSVENVVTTFNDGNANFVATETYTDGNIDFLQREGKQFGEFDWNSGPNGGQTNSVYRITGLDQVADTEYTITLDNARPASVEGTYRGTVPAALAAAQNGEATLTSITKWGIADMPDFIRADVTVNFESSAAIDVDRLLLRSGVVSDFGGGANGDFFGFSFGDQPTSDGDQTSPGGGSTE